MANQMIALGARAPQVNPIGNAIAQNAQMINLMRQQDVAERQAATAAQTAQIARAQEARAAAQEGRDIQKFELDRDALIYAKHRGMAPAVAQGGPEVYRQWLADYKADNPKVASLLEQAMPVDKFDADKFILMMGTMDQRFEARYGKAITKEMIGPNGEMFGANISGIPGASYAVPLPDISKPKPGAPGGAAPAGGFKPTRGANTTPADLKAQMPAVTPDRLEAAARAAARGARVTDPIFDGLTEDQFRQMQVRADEIRAGGDASLKPASFGGAGQPDLGGIVQQMMQTGVVSASDLQALRAAAGPQKEAQLAQLLRESNVRIMPDEQPVEGMQSAVYRPDQGGASMIEAQYNPNDYEQVRVKSPMQGPLPGSSQVPIKRIREEAQAGRKTSKEIYDEKLMEKRAENDADFMENLPKAKESASFILNLVGQMIGDANIDKNGSITVPKGGRPPKAGFEDVVGATWRPGARFIPGTNAANFDALLSQVEGQQFLQAYEKLKGTGQITEIEGQKATDAMSRMKRSVSETEFIKAAREFMGIVQTGLNRLNQREAKLGTAAPTGPRRTPTKKGGPKELRFNPATGDFE